MGDCFGSALKQISPKNWGPFSNVGDQITGDTACSGARASKLLRVWPGTV